MWHSCKSGDLPQKECRVLIKMDYCYLCCDYNNGIFKDDDFGGYVPDEVEKWISIDELEEILSKNENG